MGQRPPSGRRERSIAHRHLAPVQDWVGRVVREQRCVYEVSLETDDHHVPAIFLNVDEPKKTVTVRITSGEARSMAAHLFGRRSCSTSTGSSDDVATVTGPQTSVSGWATGPNNSSATRRCVSGVT